MFLLFQGSLKLTTSRYQDSASHFREALERWRELCLSPTFIKFSKKVDPISISMPLLLHHWSEVIDAWLEAVDIGDDEGLKPVLECVALSLV